MININDYAFVLHRRPYRETSVIVDLFTYHFGRISAVAKGVRRAKSNLKSILHPFYLLQVDLKGRSTLKTLCSADGISVAYQFHSQALISAFYVNELIVRLLPKEEPFERLFEVYQHTLASLSHNTHLEASLRTFENYLLKAIGYAIPFDFTADEHAPIRSQANYRFVVEHGFVEVPLSDSQAPDVFSGALLTNMANNQFDATETLQAAKRLFRFALQPLLGNKPLTAREIVASSYYQATVNSETNKEFSDD